jgi:hypothetical protein
MSEPGKEIEIVEKEIEDGGESGQLVPITSSDQLVVLEEMAKNADRMIAAKQKIWAACLKITKAGDWTVFTDSASGRKKAELGSAGAFRYAAFLGISFSNWTAEKVSEADEIGSWYRWDFECDAVFAGRTIRVYGRAGSRDKFFGKAHGAFKELHDVNEGDIKMAARRNAMKEGVKSLMGLHHMDPIELEAAGIKMEAAGGYAFKDKETKALEGDSVTLTFESAKMLKEGNTNGKPWKLYVVKGVEGEEFITFSDTVFTEASNFVKAKALVTVSFKKTAKGSLEIVAMSLATDPAKK